MKIYLFPPLRRALLTAMTAVPSLTAFLASSPFTSEARIWTIDGISADGDVKDYYRGGIKDKEYKDNVYKTDVDHRLHGTMSSFGGAAIAISYYRHNETSTHTNFISFYYDGIENSKFTDNYYIAQGLEKGVTLGQIAAGGAVLIADCIVGHPDMPADAGVTPSGIEWGITGSEFDGNVISSLDKIELCGGALALYSSGATRATSTLGEPLDAYLYALRDNTFTANTVVTQGIGRGGAFAIYDSDLDEGDDPDAIGSPNVTMGAINEFGFFQGGISSNVFNLNSISHLSTATVVVAEPDTGVTEFSYRTVYETDLVNSDLLMGGAIYTNSGTFNSDGNSFTGNSIWSHSTGVAIGGAIAMDGKKVIFMGIGNTEKAGQSDNRDFFNENIAYSLHNKAMGGAIADLGSSWFSLDRVTLNEDFTYASKIVANFDGNFAVGKLASAGGAIYMTEANYKKIRGHFSNNVAMSSTIAEGGALALEHSHVYALLTSGGLGWDAAAPFGVELIDATFSNNSVSHTGKYPGHVAFDMGSLAEGYGGAVSLIHNFTVNTLKTEMRENSVTADLASGGALHMRDSQINYVHANSEIDLYNDYYTLIWEYFKRNPGMTVPGLDGESTIEQDFTAEEKERYAYTFALAGVTYTDDLELAPWQKSEMVASINASLYNESGAVAFYANTATGKNGAYGGAITLERSKIRTLAVKIYENAAVTSGGIAYGGAIYMKGGLDDYWHEVFDEEEYKDSVIEYLSGEISHNYASGSTGAYGGAIALHDDAIIYDLLADFSGNSARTKSGLAAGGALALFVGTGISTLNGSYTGNYIESADQGAGGAIWVGGADISEIKGAFTSNLIQGQTTDARGGAIALSNADFDLIEASFESNKIKDARGFAAGGALSLYKSNIDNLRALNCSSNSIVSYGSESQGGAIALLESTIGSFQGAIYFNTITGTNATGGAIALDASTITFLSGNVTTNSVSGTDARGGAIALRNGSSIDRFEGLLQGNQISAGDRSISTGMGAAIYNEDSSFTYNSTQSAYIIENNAIYYSDGTVDYQFLYNTATAADKSASFTLNATYVPISLENAHPQYYHFVIRDAISGSEEFVDSQFIYINTKTVDDRASTVYLHNSVSNQTVIVENGQLSLTGSGTGSFINSHLIINSKANDGLGMHLHINDHAFDIQSRITNNHGILDIYASQLDGASLQNNNLVYQHSNIILNTVLSSASDQLDQAGEWHMQSTYNPFSKETAQGFRLSLGVDNFKYEDAAGDTTYGKQQFFLEHRYDADYYDVSQLTFDSLASFEELLLNGAFSLNIDLQQLSGRNASDVRWTFVGWESGGTVSAEALAKLEQLFSYSFTEDEVFSASGVHIHQSYNGLTLTFSDTLQEVVDAKYELSDHDRDDLFESGLALDTHAYDHATGHLSMEKKRVDYTSTLGDDLNLTSPDAKSVYFTWGVDGNGMPALNELPDGAFLPLGVISAYTLGDGVAVGAHSEYYKSYVGVERNVTFYNANNDITYMDADFVGNKTIASSLFNYLSTIDVLDGDFLGNTLTLSTETTRYYDRGALRNFATIGTINGDFILNRTVSDLDVADRAAMAGALSNMNLITLLNGDFISNYAYSRETSAYGGAIVNNTGLATIKEINGRFYSNFVQGQAALGGAIYDVASTGIVSVDGVFDANYASAKIDRADRSESLSAAGGAIYREGVTGGSEYKADFIANFAKAQVDDTMAADDRDLALYVAGGAIYHKDSSGAITVIDGDFYGNYAEIYNKTNYNVLNEGDPAKLTAVGGAIANINSTISTISSNFIANYTKVEVNEYTSTDAGVTGSESPILVAGGAIYNENGNIGLLARGRDIIFEGNRTIATHHTSGAYDPSETVTFNAIYNAQDSTISFNSYGENRIIVNDTISGLSASMSTQILDINSGRDGMGASISSNGAGFSSVEFNNLVSDQTINVQAGTLILGAYTGRTFTMADGSSFSTENSTALLENSALNIQDGARVESSAASLGKGNSITVKKGATLATSGGDLTNDIQLEGGTIELRGTMNFMLAQDGTGASLILRENSGTSVIAGMPATRSLTENKLSDAHIAMGVNTSLTISDVYLSGFSLDAATGNQVLMNQVLLDLDSSSLSMGENRVTFEDSTLTGLSVSAKQLIENPTGGIFSGPISVYTLTQLDVLSAFDFEGRLTLDLGDELLFDAGEFTAIRLTGIRDLAGLSYGDIFIRVNGLDYQIMGMTTNGMAAVSDLYLYIPEPSTATLSLLALVGLLARRRRQVA